MVNVLSLSFTFLGCSGFEESREQNYCIMYLKIKCFLCCDGIYALFSYLPSYHYGSYHRSLDHPPEGSVLIGIPASGVENGNDVNLHDQESRPMMERMNL